METKSIFEPIVRNINTNDIYFYKGDNEFCNIRTGKCGVVSDTAAQKTFLINLNASEMFNEYPLLAELVNALGLKMDNTI